MNVFLLECHIFADARAIEVAADEMLEVVGEDLVVCRDVAGDVLYLAEVREGGPAWEDHVNEHEDFLLGSVDEDVALDVVFAFVG